MGTSAVPTVRATGHHQSLAHVYVDEFYSQAMGFIVLCKERPSPSPRTSSSRPSSSRLIYLKVAAMDDGLSVKERIFFLPRKSRFKEFLRTWFIGKQVCMGQGSYSDRCYNDEMTHLFQAQATIIELLLLSFYFHGVLLRVQQRRLKISIHSYRLQRNRRQADIAEYVSSGHRFKLTIPKETCSIAFSLSGVRCPGRDEPYSSKAIALMRGMILQRDVEIEVATVDRNETFIGSLWGSKTNISSVLLEAGLTKLSSFVLGRIPDAHVLTKSEQPAKQKKLKVW